MSSMDLSADDKLAHEPPTRDELVKALAAVLHICGDDREVIDAIFAPVRS